LLARNVRFFRHSKEQQRDKQQSLPAMVAVIGLVWDAGRHFLMYS
jgi:hypothetical protein